MYEYKFEEISSCGLIFAKETALQRFQAWINKVAKDGWDLVSFHQTEMCFIVAVRKLIQS